MKRILCLLLALLLLTPAAYAAEGDMVFTMSSITDAEVGDTVTVTASVKNAPVCASFRVIFTYDDTVLKVESGKKADAKGLFMINTKAEHEGEKAVNALSADATKALEGDMDLFTVKFKVIAETAGTEGTLLDVVYEEFYKSDDLTQIHPTVEPARIYIGDDQPGGAPAPDNGGEETPAPDNGEGEETPAPDEGNDEPDTEPDTEPAPDTGVENPGNEDTPAGTTPEGNAPESSEPEKDDTPTGSWVVDEDKNEAIHVEDNGEANTYIPEFVETPEVGKETEVILRDEETGKEVGSVTVEKQPDGSLLVVGQILTGGGSGLPGWAFALIGVGVVGVGAAAAVIILVALKKKKKESEEPAHEE